MITKKKTYINTASLIGIVIVSTLLYTLTLRGNYGNPNPADFKDNLDKVTQPFELSPERGRFTHILALANDNTYALNDLLRDAALPDVGYYQGKYFSFFAPGLSYLAYPFYELGAPYNLGQVSVYAFISIMSMLALLFLFKIAREILKMPLWATLMVVLTYAFASTAWSYAITLYQHQLTTFFILASFYAIWKFEKQKRLSFLWAIFVWINYGIAIMIDYPNALLMLPVMVYLLIVTFKISKNKDEFSINIRTSALITMVFFILISGLHAYHNAFYLGSPTKISSTLLGYQKIQQEELLDIQNTEAFQSAVNSKSLQTFFSQENLPNGFYTLTVSEERGIFFYAPIFLLAFLGLYYFIKEGITRERGILLSIIALNVLLYSSWGDPWGGWAFGPRYLIPSMAVMSLLTWYGVMRMDKKAIGKGFAFLLFSISSAIALLGALTTNAIPPKSEGIFYDIKYNFFYNIDFLKESTSGSFFYKTYLENYITLEWYFAGILFYILMIAGIILFILSRYEYENHD